MPGIAMCTFVRGEKKRTCATELRHAGREIVDQTTPGPGSSLTSTNVRRPFALPHERTLSASDRSRGGCDKEDSTLWWQATLCALEQIRRSWFQLDAQMSECLPRGRDALGYRVDELRQSTPSLRISARERHYVVDLRRPFRDHRYH